MKNYIYSYNVLCLFHHKTNRLFSRNYDNNFEVQGPKKLSIRMWPLFLTISWKASSCGSISCLLRHTLWYLSFSYDLSFYKDGETPWASQIVRQIWEKNYKYTLVQTIDKKWVTNTNIFIALEPILSLLFNKYLTDLSVAFFKNTYVLKLWKKWFSLIK